MQKSIKIPILIVGATGQLGALITKHSLKQPNLEVNILVRNPDKNKELVDQVQKAGGKVIKGDVTNPETLKDSTKGIHTVISALIGDDNTVFEGQKAILDDALKNGVQRMIPSDFSIWAKKVEENEHPFLSQRLRFNKHLETTSIKGLHVWLGVFMETLFFFHSQLQPGLHYWENPDQKFDTTSYDDTARYVAAAVSNPDRVGDLRIHGDEVSINEFAAIYNKVTGKNVKPKNYGTIEDLKKKVADLRSNGDFLRAALIAYEVPLFDGRGKMEAVDNAEFPEVKPLNLEEFIKANPKTAVLPESS